MTWGLRLPLCEMAKESSFLGSKHMPGGKTSTNVYNSIADVAAETADRAKLEGFQIHPLGPLPPAAHRLFCTPTERANLQPQGRPQASSSLGHPAPALRTKGSLLSVCLWGACCADSKSWQQLSWRRTLSSFGQLGLAAAPRPGLLGSKREGGILCSRHHPQTLELQMTSLSVRQLRIHTQHSEAWSLTSFKG